MKYSFLDKNERPWPNRRLKKGAIVGHTTTTTSRLWFRTGEHGNYALYIYEKPQGEKTPEKAYGDLNKIIEDTLQLIEQPAQVENIEIITDLDEHLPLVWLDEDLIKQVIMNMLVNARHAIEGEGRITIRTRSCDEKSCPDSIMTTGCMAEITITDTGCGIPPEDLQKVFDPFFTTKGVGKGTGLGLSVSHGTVEAHRGAIEVESVVGKGTEFRIYLAIDRKDDGGDV